MRILDLLFISVLLLAQIALTVAANMLVKLGVLFSGAAGGVANLLAGLACFGFAFLLYSLVLQRLALNLAQGYPKSAVRLRDRGSGRFPQ